MKRMIAGIVVMVLLLSGCQNNTPNTPQNPTDADDPIQFSAEKNVQNKYLLADATSFQETDGFFCGTNLLGNYLQYYDKASGISGVLCADPSCAHDSNECGANIGSGASLSYYDGKLYWVGPEGSELQKRYLWQSDLSGMNRKKVMEIPFEDIIMTYQPQRYVIHQGKLYIMGSADVVDGTQTGKRVSLLSRSLTGDEGFTTVYDEVLPTGALETFRFVGGFVYISVVTFDDITSFDLTVKKIDIQKNTSEVIYQETDMPRAPEKLWVTEDHELYLTGSTGEKAYLWKIENGSKKEITFWPADEVADSDVMDGIAMLATRDENKIRYVDIRNFSGETIYSGKLFPSAISGLDKDPNTYSFAVLGGDTEKLIINLTEFANMKMVDYTILLDLKDNMKATILWSSEE